jgi:cobalt-zinc-cadmium efflux system outer membrane protein
VQHRPYADLWVAPRASHAGLPTVRPEEGSTSHTTAEGRADNPTGSVTLREAVALALQHDPALASAGWVVAASEAEARQRGRAPNPRASIAAENLGGPDSGDTFERYTLRLSQVIELSGKRARRESLGYATQRLRAWDYEAQRLATASAAASRYVAVAVSQQRVVLAEEQLALAESGLAIADDRVRNGSAPGLERDRASARVALRAIALEQARQRLLADRAGLAASWGATQATFTQAVGELDSRVELPALDTLRERLGQSPALARWDDEIAQREAVVALARANATPDPTVGAGVRYFPDADDAAAVFELGLPLQLFDDNRDAVLAARLHVSQAVAQRDHAYAETGRLLARAHAEALAADYTVRSLDGEALPASQRAYDAAVEAYAAGLSDYLTVLDAERALLDIRERRLDAVRDYHLAVIAIEKLTAHPIDADG